MAGIGFELRRMLNERDGFVAKVRAYACAGLISSGPWLMTILTLTLLNLAGPYLGGTEGYALFRALVTYAFAFSLVLQGTAQMAVTRRVADLLYAKQYNRVLPAFAASLIVIGAVHAVIGTAFCLWAEFDAALSLLAVSLFTIIGMTWIALIWLSVVRQYDDVLRAYVYGTLVAMVGVLLIFLQPGTKGILAAYTAGQAATFVLLLRTIMRGMETDGGREFGIFKSMITFPKLVGVGLFYNAAIWVDKVIFWFQDGTGPHWLVRYHPLYDTCSFLAYLTVVPALALNLVRLETSFYEKYRAYYGAILAGTPLGVIEDKRQRMFESLKESIVQLLRTQGAISVAVIVFAPLIIEFLKLPEIAVRVFRLTCLGAFFHVLLLINILMQMYYDLRKQALATTLFFFLLNGGLAWWSVNRGVETYGVGYVTASFLSLLLGYMLLHRALERLDYHSFTSQPIGSKEERKEMEALAAKEMEEEAEEEATESADIAAASTVSGNPAVAEPAATPADAAVASTVPGDSVDSDMPAESQPGPARSTPVVIEAAAVSSESPSSGEAETEEVDPTSAARGVTLLEETAAGLHEAIDATEATATDTLKRDLADLQRVVDAVLPASVPTDEGSHEATATDLEEVAGGDVRREQLSAAATEPEATATDIGMGERAEPAQVVAATAPDGAAEPDVTRPELDAEVDDRPEPKRPAAPPPPAIDDDTVAD